jgi:hypothetical protein
MCKDSVCVCKHGVCKDSVCVKGGRSLVMR